MGGRLSMARKTLYVPVLRSHRAERKALRELHANVRLITAPLIEVSRKNATKLENASPQRVAREILELTDTCGRGELYLDLAELMQRGDFDTIASELQAHLLALHSEAQLILRLVDLYDPARFRCLRELLGRNVA